MYARALALDQLWNVSRTDASNGFADVGTALDGSLMVTNETKFIVVTGSGTADLKVDTYTGLEELLNGSSSVSIDADSTGGYVYFLTRSDRYNNVVTTNNDIVDRVILPVEALSGRSTDSLYFSNSQQPTGTVLNGQYEQYVMYNNGERGYYFLDKVGATAITQANKATLLQADAFYTLTQAKTVNGQPVYTAQVVATGSATVAGDGVRTSFGNFCWANEATNTNGTAAKVAYTYYSTSNLSTCRLDDGTSEATYRVDNAKVVDLTTTSGARASTAHAEFKSILDLNNAISSGWTIDDVAVVNDGINVSTIYVLQATQH